MIAVTAGSAPARRMAESQRPKASTLAGAGRPNVEKIVDSRATTGVPFATAAATCDDKRGKITLVSVPPNSGHFPNKGPLRVAVTDHSARWLNRDGENSEIGPSGECF